MAEQTIQQEILALEKQFWQALEDRDAEAAMRLTDESCILTGAQGVGRVDRQAIGRMVADASYTLDGFAVKDDAQVRLLSDDVAIIAYTVHEDLTVDGKQVAFDAAESSTWVRRDGQWLCALHTEAIAGDPFGRDRRPS